MGTLRVHLVGPQERPLYRVDKLGAGNTVRTIQKYFMLSVTEKSIKFKTQWEVYIYMVQ